MKSLSQKRRDAAAAIEGMKAEVVEPRYGSCISFQVNGCYKWLAPVEGLLTSGALWCEQAADVELAFISGNTREVVDLRVNPGETLSLGGRKVSLKQFDMVQIKTLNMNAPLIGSFVFLVM